MSKTKGALCSAAFRKARISGITTQPTGDELAGAVETLEDMMLELESKGACTTYAYEDEPLLTTDSRLDPKWYHAVQSRLALLLCSDFGIEASATLQRQAAQAWTSMIGKLNKPNMTRYPNRMPRGSGNTQRFPTWARYYHTPERAPIDCETVQIRNGEVYPLTVDFGGFLTSGETIQSFTVKDVSGGIKVSTQQLTSDSTGVELVVEATSAGAQSLIIEITTTLSRVYPERVWFNVEEV